MSNSLQHRVGLMALVVALAVAGSGCPEEPTILQTTDSGPFANPLPTEPAVSPEGEPSASPETDGGAPSPEAPDAGPEGTPEPADGGAVDGGVFDAGAVDAGGPPPCEGTQCGEWVPTGAPLQARARHTATKLLDGRVLVAGGLGGTALATAEIYDPSSGTFSTTGAMAVTRYDHEAILLYDGRVLIAGGLGRDHVSGRTRAL